MFDKYHVRASTVGALSLAGIESMSDTEKTARITAVANDITASIIYIAKQSEAGNLTARHTTPIYDMLDKICGTEKRQKRRLLRELEKQDAQIAEMERQHRQDIHELTDCANIAISQLKARTDKLDEEVQKLKQSCLRGNAF